MPNQTKTFKESRVFGDELGGVRTLPRYGFRGRAYQIYDVEKFHVHLS